MVTFIGVICQPRMQAGREIKLVCLAYSIIIITNSTSCILCKVEHYLRMLFTHIYIHCASHERESLHIVVSVSRWCDCCCCVCGEKWKRTQCLCWLFTRHLKAVFSFSDISFSSRGSGARALWHVVWHVVYWSHFLHTVSSHSTYILIILLSMYKYIGMGMVYDYTIKEVVTE